LKSYLEIGLDSGCNFNSIVCDEKESVDPYFEEDHDCYDMHFKENLPDNIMKILTYRMTSDEFFKQNNRKYDIIFVDGLHTEEQVGRDIINSLKTLNDGGFVVVHDCLPKSERAQIVPRSQGEWNGTVWKAIVELTRQGLDIKVWECDYGCGIIRKQEDTSLLEYPEKCKCTWQEFSNDKNSFMNILTTKQLLEII
jgi:hypothetical protein